MTGRDQEIPNLFAWTTQHDSENRVDEIEDEETPDDRMRCDE